MGDRLSVVISTLRGIPIPAKCRCATFSYQGTIAKSKAPIKLPVVFDVRTKSDTHLLERSEIRAACPFARMRRALAQHLIQFQLPVEDRESINKMETQLLN